MFRPVDTSDPSQVEGEVLALYQAMYPEADPAIVSRSFSWARQCFTGQFDGYQAIDARYHDLEHTLQGTLCMSRLLHGRHQAGATPQVSRPTFDLGLLAILFHDTGYLKKEEDASGTGAKYTLTHVRRSAEFARLFLLKQGFSEEAVRAIQNMIRCTGVSADVAHIDFECAEHRVVGFALATGDLLGQMAARDYVDKLPVLWQEFAEAIAYSGDRQCRLARWKSAGDLVQNTPAFFENYVMPRVENEFGGLYRYLNQPYPDGPNPYLQRIQENLSRIRKGGDD